MERVEKAFESDAMSSGGTRLPPVEKTTAAGTEKESSPREEVEQTEPIEPSP